MAVETLYQELLLDHAKNPRNAGLREPYDAQTHQVNPTCGDEITVRVRLDGERVADVSYDALGCSISMAAASVMTELVTGRPVAEGMAALEGFRALMHARGEGEPDEDLLGDGIAFAGVARYPSRVTCALMSWLAWQEAVLAAGERPAAHSAIPFLATTSPSEETT